MFLRIHSFLPYSRANGPGVRAVIWTQGCSLGCPGCFNPATHAFDGGEAVSVGGLFEQIRALTDSIEGLTVSGGEPFQQLRPLTSLLQCIRQQTKLSVIVFTGYEMREIRGLGGNHRREDALAPGARDHIPCLPAVLDYIDVLISGRYDARQRLASGLKGSANQTVQFVTSRYMQQDIDNVPDAEIILGSDGRIWLTGTTGHPVNMV